MKKIAVPPRYPLERELQHKSGKRTVEASGAPEERANWAWEAVWYFHAGHVPGAGQQQDDTIAQTGRMRV